MKSVNWLIRLCFLLSISINAFALPSDRNQPIKVQANQAALNNNSGIIIYTGAVVITQGTTVIEADKVTLYRNKQGKLTRMLGVSQSQKLTYYKEKINAAGELLKAWGKTIDYHVQSQQIDIIKKGKLDKEHNTLIGEHIVYNMKTQQVSAATTSSSRKKRVEMIIQPNATK